MLEILNKAIKRALHPNFIEEFKFWNSLYIDYEEPLVERMWVEDGKNRIYAHKIHPCKTPFYHPHPWPSAMLVLGGGRYKMEIGVEDHIISRMVLSDLSYYEMDEPEGWHSVQPIDEPIFSLMVTGKPWESGPYDQFKTVPQQRAMTREEKILFLMDFMDMLRDLDPYFEIETR
jgi:hypothetical protein